MLPVKQKSGSIAFRPPKPKPLTKTNSSSSHKSNRSNNNDSDDEKDEPKKIDVSELLQRPSSPIPPAIVFENTGKTSNSELHPGLLSTGDATKTSKDSLTNSGTPSSQPLGSGAHKGARSKFKIEPESIAPIAGMGVPVVVNENESPINDPSLASSAEQASSPAIGGSHVKRGSMLKILTTQMSYRQMKTLKVYILCVNFEMYEESKLDEEDDEEDESDTIKCPFVEVGFENMNVSLEDIVDVVVSHYNSENRNPPLIQKAKLYSLFNVDDEGGVPEATFKMEIEDFPNAKVVGLCLADGVKEKDVIRPKPQSKYPEISVPGKNPDRAFIRIVLNDGSHVVEVPRTANLKQLLIALSKKRKCAMPIENFSGFTSDIHPELYDWETKVSDLGTITVNLVLAEEDKKVKVFPTEIPDPTNFVFTIETASEYKEYRVIKQNRVGKKQNRKMGIDAHRIYNLPDVSASPLPMIASVKRPSRELRDVVKAEIVRGSDNKHFQILFSDLATNAIVKYRYEAMSAQECAEIVAKIEFLCKNL